MKPWAHASFLVLFVWLIGCASAFAGRPLSVDDAAPVATGQLDFELGFSQARPIGGGRDHKLPMLGLTYGVYQNLQLGIAIQRANQDGPGSAPVRGFEDLHLTAKYKFVQESPALPAFAAALDIKLPSASRAMGLSTGRGDEALLLIASKTFTPIALHANLGYRIVGDRPGDRLNNIPHGGAALEWLITPHWSLVGEITGAGRAANPARNEANILLGGRFSALPNLVLDMAVGRTLRSTETAIQGTFGLTWTLDLTHTQRP